MSNWNEQELWIISILTSIGYGYKRTLRISLLDILLCLIILTYSGARLNTDKNLNAEISSDKEIAETTDKVLLLAAQLLIKKCIAHFFERRLIYRDFLSLIKGKTFWLVRFCT